MLILPFCFTVVGISCRIVLRGATSCYIPIGASASRHLRVQSDALKFRAQKPKPRRQAPFVKTAS